MIRLVPIIVATIVITTLSMTDMRSTNMKREGRSTTFMPKAQPGNRSQEGNWISRGIIHPMRRMKTRFPNIWSEIRPQKAAAATERRTRLLFSDWKNCDALSRSRRITARPERCRMG